MCCFLISSSRNLNGVLGQKTQALSRIRLIIRDTARTKLVKMLHTAIINGYMTAKTLQVCSSENDSKSTMFQYPSMTFQAALCIQSRFMSWCLQCVKVNQANTPINKGSFCFTCDRTRFRPLLREPARCTCVTKVL